MKHTLSKRLSKRRAATFAVVALALGLVACDQPEPEANPGERPGGGAMQQQSQPGMDQQQDRQSMPQGGAGTGGGTGAGSR